MGVQRHTEWKPPLVLLFEEPSVTEALDLDLLQNRGVRVKRFSSGRQALTLAGDRAPRLCLVPMELPDMQARELAARLGELFGPEHVSVVALLREGTAEDGPVDPAWFAASALLPARVRAMQVLMDRFVGVRLRRAERFPIRVGVFADEVPGTTLDLSTTGVKIRADRPLDVGSRVELKFSLPGSAESVTAAGRVVRVDTRTWAPQAAVAIQFESLGPGETRRLEDYISSLIGGRTFRWHVEEQEEQEEKRDREEPQKGSVAVLIGSLRRTDDLQDLAVELSGPVRLDLGRLKKIEWKCLDDWQAWLTRLDAENGPLTIDQIHFDLALQSTTDRRVLAGFTVRTVQVPHVCENCGAAEPRPVNVGNAAPEPPCSRCGGVMTADEEIPPLGVP